MNVSIVNNRETQLNSERSSFLTPPIPNRNVQTASPGVAGLGAIVSPTYEGSKKIAGQPLSRN